MANGVSAGTANDLPETPVSLRVVAFARHRGGVVME
jgi:hypothetical protein